jgi:hypothetical protein
MTTYYCENCGKRSDKWIGKCPSCDQWNTFIEKDKTNITSINELENLLNKRNEEIRIEEEKNKLAEQQRIRHNNKVTTTAVITMVLAIPIGWIIAWIFCVLRQLTSPGCWTLPIGSDAYHEHIRNLNSERTPVFAIVTIVIIIYAIYNLKTDYKEK